MNDHLVPRSDDSAKPRRARKGLYILPSIFTAGNIAAGYYAISQAIQGTASDPWHFNQAAKAIGIAIVLDFFDGGIARLTNTASPFGRELDSLADVIAFGIAPAILAWTWGFRMLPHSRGSGYSRARHSTRRYRDLHFSPGGGVPSGAFQHPDESAALESRPAGAQVFCRSADPRRGWSHCRRSSSGPGQSTADLVALHRMGRVRLRDFLPDGEHLAVCKL